jgi:hypothetical protein
MAGSSTAEASNVSQPLGATYVYVSDWASDRTLGDWDALPGEEAVGLGDGDTGPTPVDGNRGDVTPRNPTNATTTTSGTNAP